MAKTSGGIRVHGRIGYAVFDENGKQMSRAMFGNGHQAFRWVSGRAQAQHALRIFRQGGLNNYTIGRARREY